MKLFQYWDGAQPPADVAGWVDGFRTRNPEFEHVLLNEATSLDFITRHYGPREAAAFRACAVPAMQADLIRLCVLDVFGGVYVDADNQSLRPLSELIDRAPRSLAFLWTGLINNGFLMFRRPADPFVRACLALTLDNIEARRFEIEFTATGPGVVNAVRAVADPSCLDTVLAAFDNPVCCSWGLPALVEHARAMIPATPELIEAVASLTLMHALAASPWIGADQPSYKQGDRHWPNWKGAIYR